MTEIVRDLFRSVFLLRVIQRDSDNNLVSSDVARLKL